MASPPPAPVPSCSPAPGAATVAGVLTALAAVTMLVAAGCGEDDRGAAQPVAPRLADPVLVIGDSLTVDATRFGGLDETLAEAGWEPEVVAESGQDILWGREQVAARSEVPGVVVVALGTNTGAQPEGFGVHAAAMVVDLVARGATDVVWVPPVDAGGQDYAAQQQALAALAAGDPDGPLHVAGWPARIGANPAWFSPDGIHYTREGYRNFAVFIADAIEPFAS